MFEGSASLMKKSKPDLKKTKAADPWVSVKNVITKHIVNGKLSQAVVNAGGRAVVRGGKSPEVLNEDRPHTPSCMPTQPRGPGRDPPQQTQAFRYPSISDRWYREVLKYGALLDHSIDNRCCLPLGSQAHRVT
jgi:hypothetical protein